MVGRSAAESALFPAFVQCAVELICDHIAETFLESFERIVTVADLNEGFEYIFLHVRARVLVGLHELEDSLVFVAVRDSRENSHCVYAVVGVFCIVRMSVCFAVPALVERSLDTCLNALIFWYICLIASDFRHIDRRLECKVMPGGEDETDVDVITPVAPRPFALSVVCQTFFVQCPYAKVFLNCRVDIFHCLLVSGVEVIVPESVGTYRA